MNIGIVGGRDFNNYDLLKKNLDAYIENQSILTAIVSGGAPGTDTLAEKYAQELAVDMIVYRPDYKKFGRGAALARNTQIIEHSDVVFAFWDGKSRGTMDSINKAKKLAKQLFIISY